MPVTVDVDRLEYAVLAQRSGVSRVPVVASYSSHGTTVSDVKGEFDAAEQRCRRRGLLDRSGGVNDAVGELLRMYPRAGLEYDLRFSAQQGSELRAAVSQLGRSAVRTVLNGDRVHVEEVRADQAIPALVSVLPEHAPARVQPTGLDQAALKAIAAQHPDGNQRAIETELRSRGVDTRAYRNLTQLLDGPKLGIGQVGVTAWGQSRSEHRGQQTVQVIDVASGRLALYDSRGQRMVVGADLATFSRVLGELAETARRGNER